MLKTFVNDRKVPLLPILLVNWKLVTNSLQTANIFNDFLSQQYQLILNDSIIPSMCTSCTNRLSDISLNYAKMFKVIKSGLWTMKAMDIMVSQWEC